MELLACAIRHHREIYREGFISTEQKLVLFSGDSVLFISEPYNTIPVFMQKIDAFSKIAGYFINWSKLELMPVSENLVIHPFKEY